MSVNKKIASLAMGVALTMVFSSNAMIVGVSDDFDNDSGTFSSWTSVGATTTVINYDAWSNNDYDDGDLTQKLAWDSATMTATGDGVRDDGGLKLDSQNAIEGDEAIGLTIGGTMGDGEVITFSGSMYNDGLSAYNVYAVLWNLTDNTSLATSARMSVKGRGHIEYVPQDFSLQYTALASDAGDTLQIRFVEDNNNAVRDVHVDSFAVIPEPATLGLVGSFGMAVLFIRRRLAM